MSGWLPLQLPRPWAGFPCRRHLTLQHKVDLITSGHNLALVLLKIELRRPSVCAYHSSAVPTFLRRRREGPSIPGNWQHYHHVYGFSYTRSGLD